MQESEPISQAALHQVLSEGAAVLTANQRLARVGGAGPGPGDLARRLMPAIAAGG